MDGEVAKCAHHCNAMHGDQFVNTEILNGVGRRGWQKRMKDVITGRDMSTVHKGVKNGNMVPPITPFM
eukprot:1800340-Amphidinium_carterae.1